MKRPTPKATAMPLPANRWSKPAHLVPAEVAVAIASGRSQLLVLGEPRTLSPEERAGLYGVIGDMIDDNFEKVWRIRRLGRALREARESLEALQDSAKAVSAVSISTKRVIDAALAEEGPDEIDEDGE